jgi:peptidoglycan/LPS O-acetylase OafA/YrhL
MIAGSPPKRLAGLDGFRGLAALYVVVYHIFLRAFPGYPVDRAPFWAGWFAYGRLAVGILTAGIVQAGNTRRSWPWHRLALAAAAPVAAAIWWQGTAWTNDNLLWVDLALSPAIACLLDGLAIGRPARLLRALDAGPMRKLGAASYSVYLIHAPIVVVVYEKIVAGRVGQGVPAFLVSIALVPPLTVLFARVFSRLFETPFSRRGSWPVALRRQRARVGVAPG